MKIEKLLSLFNLRSIEAEIYQVLFENGALSATALAKQANISRTSVYDLLKSLIQKGLVVETQKGGIKIFSAVPLEKVKLLIEEKEKDLKEAKIVLTELSAQQFKQKKFSTPRLQIFEGQEALRQMMKDMLLYHNTTVYVFWPIKKIIVLLSSGFMEKFHKDRIKQNIEAKVIWPKSQIPTLQKYSYLSLDPKWKREVKIAPPEISFSLGYAIYGNTVRFISSQKESFGFLVESRELAEMMKGQFEAIWKISKPLKIKSYNK